MGERIEFGLSQSCRNGESVGNVFGLWCTVVGGMVLCLHVL